MEPGTGLKAVGLCLCLRNRAAHPHLELFPYSFLYGNVQKKKKKVFSTQTSANAILTWGEKVYWVGKINLSPNVGQGDWNQITFI